MSDEDLQRILSKDADYYQVLGVESDASEKEIESAYRSLVKKFHPDVSDYDESDVTVIFQRIQKARDVLTDPRARQTYDSVGHERYVAEVNTNQTTPTTSDEEGTTHAPEKMRHSDEVHAQSNSRTRNRNKARKRREKESAERERIRKQHQEQEQNNHTGESDASNRSIQEQVQDAVWKPYHVLESRLGDDVISTAVRRAWAARFGYTAGVLVVLFVLAQLATMAFGQSRVIPTFNTALAHPEIGVGIGIIAVILGFGYDQYNTETETDRGGINVAGTPHAWYRTIALNIVGVVLFLLAIQNNVEPLTEMTTLVLNPNAFKNGWILTGSHALLLNGVLALIMLFSLAAGAIMGLPTLTRLVWYDRYVRGRRTLPVVWDAILFIPIMAYIWTFLSPQTKILIPTIVGQFLMTLLGGLSAGIGITQSSISESALLFGVLALPVLIGIPLGIRRALEYGYIRVTE